MLQFEYNLPGWIKDIWVWKLHLWICTQDIAAVQSCLTKNKTLLTSLEWSAVLLSEALAKSGEHRFIFVKLLLEHGIGKEAIATGKHQFQDIFMIISILVCFVL